MVCLTAEIRLYVIVDNDENTLNEEISRFLKTKIFDGLREEHFSMKQA